MWLDACEWVDLEAVAQWVSSAVRGKLKMQMRVNGLRAYNIALFVLDKHDARGIREADELSRYDRCSLGKGRAILKVSIQRCTNLWAVDDNDVAIGRAGTGDYDSTALGCKNGRSRGHSEVNTVVEVTIASTGPIRLSSGTRAKLT